MTAIRTSRDLQREQTRARIADAARRSFAEHGYDRTTIRQVASDAKVDPALVMHYFGSKHALFASVVRVTVEQDTELQGSPVNSVLSALATKLGGMNEQTLAGLRSMLTHPEATAHAREVLQQETDRLADRLDGPHADTRAALLLATNLGVAISREVLGLRSLCDSQPNDLLDLLKPAVRAPRARRVVYKKIHLPDSPTLSGIVDFLEEGVAAGTGVLELTGSDLAALCNEVAKGSRTCTQFHEESIIREPGALP